MLNYLKITNLALMASAEVEFHTGFNVITGETGAGKSILLGTVALLLGSRADKSLIRQGCSRCEIVGAITVDLALYPELNRLCQELEIDDDSGELRLRRVITQSSNRCYINDTPVNLQTLGKIGSMLIDVHSANEQYTLLDHTRQLGMLDRFGQHSQEVLECQKIFQQRKELNAQFALATEKLPSPAESELLQAMKQDIERVNPEVGEDELVSKQFSLVANSREVLEISTNLTTQLTDSENALVEQLSTTYRLLVDLDRLADGALSEQLEECSNISSSIQELSANIEQFANSIELDEESLANLESRLGSLQNLKRRYGPKLDDVLAKLADATERLELASAAEEFRQKHLAQEQALTEKLAKACDILTQKRQTSAQKLATETTELLHRLGLPHAVLEIRLTPKTPTENGADEPEFYFSANRGMSVQPLRLMASSGELSRVMLAMKATLAGSDDTAVLIFDEIDVNIGGETACQVAETIANLATERQVLCISHLAQVAARGDHHFAVTKSDEEGMTQSTIIELDHEQRIQELARMLGGGNAATLHATELLTNSVKSLS